MNRQAHLVIGAGLFLIYFYMTGLFHSMAGERFILGIIGVAVGSLFPDFIEPATSARHRGLFHSRRALKFAGVAFLFTTIPVLFVPLIPRSLLLFCISCFFLGYTAHLLADSVTRAGLPW
jgi:membrane-bound metal-dependent hydrolase YbcI (DUF457 family)